MPFTRTGGHFEVPYAEAADMDPALQSSLLDDLRVALGEGRVSVLFLVKAIDVPRAVPAFWFSVTQQLAPGLCAMAIVSDSLAVRAAASAFSVTNRIRRVKVAVKSFTAAELETARRWCAAERAASSSSAPTG